MPTFDASKNRWAASAAIADLGGSSGGTADGSMQAISATYTQAEVANNFAELQAKVNAILAALRAAGIIAS